MSAEAQQLDRSDILPPFSPPEQPRANAIVSIGVTVLRYTEPAPLKEQFHPLSSDGDPTTEKEGDGPVERRIQRILALPLAQDLPSSLYWHS